MTVEPIRQTVTVHCGIELPFDVFTNRLGDWWPKQGHSIGEDEIDAIIVEGRCRRADLRMVAQRRVGVCGEVTVWDPPHRLALSWMPNPTATAVTDVDVQFEALSDVSTRAAAHPFGMGTLR